MLKKLFMSVRGKLYFIPGLYAVFFAVVAVAFMYMDSRIGNRLMDYVPAFLSTSRVDGSSILSMTVGSLFAMMTFTFSIMMVVLTIYGSQLSPRTLQDFMEKKVTLRILGFFIGSLVFTVIALFSIKPQNGSGVTLVPAVGVTLMIAAVFVFVYFIHYISKSIQVTLYIQNLVNETVELIEKKQKATEEAPEISSGNLDEYADILGKESYTVMAPRSGFIQYYDERKLFELAKENGIVIHCGNMLGKHILEDEELLKIYGPGSGKLSEEVRGKVISAVLIGDETNLYEDIGAGTQKLVEIAVRALSPGVNDPGTAVFCIEKIGFLLQKAAKGLEARIYSDDSGNVRLIVQSLIFERLLFDHFYQIRHYGLEDLFVFDAIVGALIMIAKESTKEVSNQVWRFSQYLVSGMDIEEYHDMERAYVEERLYQLAAASGQKAGKP